MTGPTDLSIVIPAFNEAARLPDTLEAIVRHLSATDLSWEIRVVDDGSADATVAKAAAAAAQEARIIVQQEPHRGKGGAVRAGMLAATARMRFLCDADLSMPIAELGMFLRVVPATADVAIGVREGVGARRIGEPSKRHIMGRAFNALVRHLLIPGVQDTQCGFKLFSAEAAEAIFSRVGTDGWAFDVEALFVARKLGLRVAEVPITWHYSAESRVSPFWDALRMARDVVGIRWKAWRGGYRLHKQ